MDGPQEPAVAVVMPAYNAAAHLEEALGAVLAAGGNEVLVVDPGSTDGTAELAERLGARVVRLGERAGPARARNAGAASVEAPVILFLDADCVAHADVVEQVQRAFREDPHLVSLTGSYDDDPPERGFFSLYMNLRHHHTHQRARREEATFWAGCGAVRRSAFEEAGGFDEERYPRPMIEDIDLAQRLRTLGTTRLDPDLQVTHLKRWTLRSVVTTDILQRALPWTRLIRRSGKAPDDLNLRTSQRISAGLSPLVVAAPFVLVGLAAAALATERRPSPLWALLALPVAISLALQWDLVRLFARRRGPAFALCAWLFHQVHLLYSGVTFVIGHILPGRP